MSYETTLFAHIAPRLTDRIEDVAVEALGHILSNSEAARSALEETVGLGGAIVGPIDRVQTQVTDEEGARPDLVGFDDQGTKRVLIEAKFWAGLTPNQPNHYLERLPQDRPAALLFVAPKARLELLWPKLCGRAEKDFTLCKTIRKGDLRASTVSHGKRRLMLTSWAALLDLMETQANDAGDATAAADIRQLRGLTDRAEPDPFLPWRPGKLESELAKRIVGLRRLIDDATVCGKKAGFLKGGRFAKGGLGGYGRKFWLGGVWVWFGAEVFAWARYASTPLWLRFGRDKHSRLKEAELTDRMFDPGPGWDFRMPIELPAGVDYDEMLDSVVNCLNCVARRLDPKIAPDAVHESGIEQLRRSADRMDAYAFQPWRPEELEPKHAQGLIRLHGIIDEAISCGKDAGILQQAKKKLRQEGYGWSILLAGVEMWFGIDVTAWAQNSGTPLWLLFEHEEQQELAYVTDILKKVDWRHCIPIDVPADAENDAVLDSVVASLKRIAERLDPPDAPRSVELEQDQNSG